jgi:thioredoxin 1
MFRSSFPSSFGRRQFFLPVFVLLLLLAMAGCSQADAPAANAPATSTVNATLYQPTGIPRLVDLGADKCIPCIAMAPILEELKKDYNGRFEVEFIDVWKRREEAGRYGVRMIPTQIFYDGAGQELYRRSGFIGKEDILATWKKLGYDFGN